jgi:hypothetical protein
MFSGTFQGFEINVYHNAGLMSDNRSIYDEMIELARKVSCQLGVFHTAIQHTL